MNGKMTDGEKMVWAAAFAAASVAGRDRYGASSAGDDAVYLLKECVTHNDHTARDFASSDTEPSDIEAALVEALAKCERGEMFFKEPCTAAGRFRDEVERRIGRPLRGAK